MRSFLTLFLILCISSGTFAQHRKKKQDPLYQKLLLDSAHIYRQTIIKPYLKVEIRRSFINRSPVGFIGFMSGFTFHEKHIVSIGYYFLDRRNSAPLQFSEGLNYTSVDVKINYLNLSYQYILFNRKYWQLNIPLELGYGHYNISLQDNATRLVNHLSGKFVPVQLGLFGIIKPVERIGISLSLGYRYVRETENKPLDLNFKGWYYAIGLWVDGRGLKRNGQYFMKKRAYHRQIRLIRQAKKQAKQKK